MIKNLNPHITTTELKQKVASGAKFVYFEYTVSIAIATFKRPTDIYFIDANESTAKHSWHLSTLTGIMGWWGIPWGPIYTIGAFITNFGGGKDVTAEIMQKLLANERLSATQNSQTATSAYGVNHTTSGSGNNSSSQNTGNSGGASQYNIPR
jgi:hypothetical protein